MTRLKALIARARTALTPTRSTWVQNILALSTVATVITLAALQMPIPEILSGIAWVVVGYFFGTLKSAPASTDRPPVPATLEGKSKGQRTRHGRSHSKLIHFQCVEPNREAST